MSLLNGIEDRIKVFLDIKKDFLYDKSTGKWFWFDKDEKDNREAYHGPFDCFVYMIYDATNPYFEEEFSA